MNNFYKHQILAPKKFWEPGEALKALEDKEEEAFQRQNDYESDREDHWQEILDDADKQILKRLLTLQHRSPQQQRLAERLATKLGYDFDGRRGEE